MISLNSDALAARASRAPAGVTILAAALAVTVAFPWAVGPLAHLAYDEQIYHLMVRAIDTANSLHLWNGYEEFPAKELVLPLARIHDGRLAAQYPYLFGVLAVPFYRAFGFAGLLLVNAVAYAAAVALTVALAQRLFGDRRLAIAAGLILVFATYSWQYSQAVWPHSLAMLMIVGGVYAAALAADRRQAGSALGLAVASGLILGFGAGVRLDCVLAIPPVAAWLLVGQRRRVAHAMAVCAGAVPGLAVLAYTNYVKFGLLMPFTYGYANGRGNMAVGGYAAVISGSGLVLLAVWLLWRYRRRWQEKITARSAAAILVSLAITATWLAWPWVSRFADGFYQLVVDLRIRDLGIREIGLTRGPGGSMIYLGGVQKAFLQSCPYLTVLLIPFVGLIVGRRNASPLALPFLVCATFVAAFSYFAWHGGLVLHMRYFVSILPLTAIATAWAWREITDRTPLSRSFFWGALASGILVTAALIAWVGYREVDRTHEAVLLTVPLVLAAAVLILSVAWIATAGGGALWRERLSKWLGGCLLAGFAWGGVVALSYDHLRDLALRKFRADLAEELAPFVRSDSLVMAMPRFNIMGLFGKDRVRLGLIDPDHIPASRPLIEHQLGEDRPVYLWLEPDRSGRSWHEIAPAEAAAAYAPLRLEPLHESRHGRLFRIRRPSG